MGGRVPVVVWISVLFSGWAPGPVPVWQYAICTNMARATVAKAALYIALAIDEVRKLLGFAA